MATHIRSSQGSFERPTTFILGLSAATRLNTSAILCYRVTAPASHVCTAAMIVPAGWSPAVPCGSLMAGAYTIVNHVHSNLAMSPQPRQYPLQALDVIDAFILLLALNRHLQIFRTRSRPNLKLASSLSPCPLISFFSSSFPELTMSPIIVRSLFPETSKRRILLLVFLRNPILRSFPRFFGVCAA